MLFNQLPKPVQRYLQLRVAEFETLINSEECKSGGVLPTLKKAGYKLRFQGKLTQASKGRILLTFGDNPINSAITLL